MQKSLDYELFNADVDSIAQVSREEEALLLQRIRLASEGCLPLHLGLLAKRRLLEGSQRLVLFLAGKQRRFFRFLSINDLIQEGNLALWKEIEHFPSRMPNSFSAYAAAVLRTAFTRARARDLAIYVPPASGHRLKKSGKIREIDALQPASIDVPMRREDRSMLQGPSGGASRNRLRYATVADYLASTVPLPETAQDPRQAEQEGQLSTILAHLTQRQQQVLRLRYGLDPSDPYEHTTSEIAGKLHLSVKTVTEHEREALKALRRLSQQQAEQASEQRIQPAVPMADPSPVLV